jgi:hypothetical protein
VVVLDEDDRDTKKRVTGNVSPLRNVLRQLVLRQRVPVYGPIIEVLDRFNP